MPLDLTDIEIEELWNKGFRPYEIYIRNRYTEVYFGQQKEPNTINGWEIKHVFSTREHLESFPFFDEVIGRSDLSACEAAWRGR